MGNARAPRRGVVFVISVAMIASLVVPAPAMAASTVTGGPDEFPVVVANGHTPIAVHYWAGGASSVLTPNTTYYVKVRFTVGTTPGGATNRGYTWNPSNRRWVQERENKPDWSAFPSVRTDGSGNIPSDSGWLFAKFGDETKTGEYHVMVSLNLAGSDTTYNSSITPTVTVYASAVDGSLIHNRNATGAAGASEVRVTGDASTTLLSSGKTEPQGVDDDANGTVDDEDWGAAGAAGDFHVAVPASTIVKVSIGGQPWGPGLFATGPADTDIAVDAAERSAPTAPGGLVVHSGDGVASLAWAAASDNVGVAGYYVYRWTPAVTGAAYTNVHARIATLGPGTTSFGDTGLTNGAPYFYEVRAFDAATNVGPASTIGSALPQVSAPSASVTPASPGDSGWYSVPPTITLSPSTPGRTVQYAFESSPAVWTAYAGPLVVTDGDRTLYYRETDGVTASAVQSLGLRVDTVAPRTTVSAPTFTVQQSAGRTFTVSWSAVDAGSGVESYDVDWKNGATGAWTTLRSSTSATSTTISGSGGATYYFRAHGRDAAGNVGDETTSTGTTFPNDQSKATFSSGWKTASRTSAFMGSTKYATRSGASASFKLSHGVLYLVATTGPKSGKLAVYFRGHKVATIDTYSKSSKQRQTFKVATFSGSSSGTVKVVNLATSHRPRVELDGFAVRW